ncbi:MAG: hypothetical protein KAS62_06035, partial [Candidatus Delongbacteria bacterium]|nr:hypothetical protein [Candidatus Delongbacteria bacterium]
MLKKYNWVIILLFISGAFLLVTAQNNFENPLPHDMDNMHDLDGDHPRSEGFENGRRGEGRRGKNIPPEVEKKIIIALETHFPVFRKKAARLKETHPRIYKKLLHKLRRHIRREKEPKE